MKKSIKPTIYKTIALTGIVAVAVFFGYTLGYQQQVELVEAYNRREHKVILPVTEPRGSKIMIEQA